MMMLSFHVRGLSFSLSRITFQTTSWPIFIYTVRWKLQRARKKNRSFAKQKRSKPIPKSRFENRINHDARAFEQAPIFGYNKMIWHVVWDGTEQNSLTKWWPISSDQNREHLAINLRSLNWALARATKKSISENQSIYTVCWTPISNHDEFNFHATAIILFIVYPAHHICWLSARNMNKNKERWKSMREKINVNQKIYRMELIEKFVWTWKTADWIKKISAK